MTTPDADYAYEALLRFNYFPMVKEHRDEIRPVVSSEAFTPTIADAMISAGTGRGGEGFDQIEYRTTRFNNVVRKIDIPHPYPYAKLCQTIRDNWDLLKHVCLNDLSRIRPERHGERLVIMGEYDTLHEVDGPGRLVVMDKTRFPDDVLRHLELATGAKFWVEADIANCFPSIYTHAIPWAIVGHSVAKATRTDKSKWYNELDKSQRLLKRAETQGVPIGPATSNLICEVILEKVDVALTAKGYRFVRFIDDYKCFTDSHDLAEKFIRDLERELDRFLLKLNAKKVSIRKLPLPHKASWVNELTIAVDATRKFGASQIVGLLDYALHLQNENPDGSVVKYAARMLISRLSKANVSVFVRHLLYLSVHHPIVLPLACEALQIFRVDCDAKVLRQIIREHLEYRRSDGVSWAIYLTFLAREKLGARLRREIVASEDCLAMACLVATKSGTSEVDLFLNGLDLATIEKYELDRYWLLIHERALAEATIRTKFKPYLDETKLSVLATKKVSFLRTPSIREMARKKASPFGSER